MMQVFFERLDSKQNGDSWKIELTTYVRQEAVNVGHVTVDTEHLVLPVVHDGGDQVEGEERGGRQEVVVESNHVPVAVETVSVPRQVPRQTEHGPHTRPASKSIRG